MSSSLDRPPPHPLSGTGTAAVTGTIAATNTATAADTPADMSAVQPTVAVTVAPATPQPTSPQTVTTQPQPPQSTKTVHSTLFTRNPHLTQSMSDSARPDNTVISTVNNATPPLPLSLQPSITSSTTNSTTTSMSASSTAPKPFPYQISKDHTSGGTSDEWTIIEATPADPRFADEIVHVQINAADAAYSLKPVHCGRQVVFLNAMDAAFYKRQLMSPALTVWILCSLTVGQSHALKRMFESGWRQNIQVTVMEVNKFELVASKDGLENILYEGRAVDLPDCIFNRVGANVSYFGLAVIRQLENMGCLILNTLKSIEIARDKMLTMQCLSIHGLPIPKTLLAKFPMNLETIKREFTYPIIIKKVSGSQGKGIIKVDSHAQLEDLVDMLDTGKPLIFQEFIEASTGKDLRVFVIGGRVVGAMMRIAAKGNFKANVHQGGTVKPVKISPQVEWLVLETVKIIGLDIAGVDLLIDRNTYKICEVNSSPGFEGLEKATGENIAIKMFLYMKMRLGVWRRTKSKAATLTGGVTVPIDGEHQDNDMETIIANGINRTDNDNNDTAISAAVSSAASSSSSSSSLLPSSVQRTLPRNRSTKRTSQGERV